jgi:hypothetical protein
MTRLTHQQLATTLLLMWHKWIPAAHHQQPAVWCSQATAHLLPTTALLLEAQGKPQSFRQQFWHPEAAAVE